MAAIAVMAWTAPAHALAPGDKLSGKLELGAKQVPLPAGSWTVAGMGIQPFRMAAIGAFGTIQNVILFQVRDNAVVAVLEVNVNAIPVNDGWGRTRSCNPDSHELMLITRYKTGWETSCQFVRPTQFNIDTKGPAAWEQARDYARQNKLSMASVWLTAGFRVSDRQDIIDARFHISPTLMLGSEAATLSTIADWSGAVVKSNPLREGAVQAVAAWASGYDAWVERGLRNQITEPPGPLPQVGTKIEAYDDPKIADLRRLYGEGRISKEALDAQIAIAKAEVPEYKPNTSLVSQSVKKNISFRSFGTFVDYAIAYVVTASNYVSWGIALTLNASDSVWFVLNDQYWDNYYAKLNTHDSERLVDFVYIGENGNPAGIGVKS